MITRKDGRPSFTSRLSPRVLVWAYHQRLGLLAIGPVITNGSLAASLLIGVFDAEDELPAGVAGEEPGGEGGEGEARADRMGRDDEGEADAVPVFWREDRFIPL